MLHGLGRETDVSRRVDEGPSAEAGGVRLDGPGLEPDDHGAGDCHAVLSGVISAGAPQRDVFIDNVYKNGR